jgi:hypothetical protein
MLNGNDRKFFTATCDADAEKLLSEVLNEMRNSLDGTGLCVVLGGSYGRGDGGVRLDRENGILYNDLDFFVFARKKLPDAGNMLKNIAKKYEHELKVDVDFSRIMTLKDIKNNAPRLMMQELKRGYYPVCGEDLLAEYLPELPAAELPYSEACRLLLNRGMGLYLAGEKIAGKSNDTDFILRNIYKAILGAGDALLIASGEYRWKIAERLDFTEKNDILASWQFLYREAVDFKHSPHRELPRNITAFWLEVRDFYRAALLRCAGADNAKQLAGGIYRCSKKSGEISLKNLLKYCVKLRTLPLRDWKLYAIPPAAVILPELYKALDDMPQAIDRESRLYRHWQVFN